MPTSKKHARSKPDSRIYPVVLTGGVGSRLWPLSTPDTPKPFWPLFSDKTLLAETLARVDGSGFAPPLFVANVAQQRLLADALRPLQHTKAQAKAQAWQLFEPQGRNTAAAIALAAQFALTQWGDVTLLILPSDHYIARPARFRVLLPRAQRAAQAGGIVTFGIVPTHAHTGLGYIQLGARNPAGGRRIARFCEKPQAAQAKRWIASGAFVWNSGMFMAQASVFHQALTAAQPRLSKGVAQSLAGARRRGQNLWPAAAPFARIPALPFDIAVMENSKQGVVFPADIGWSDVGSWQALWALLPKDKAGNVVHGAARVIEGQNNYVRTSSDLPPIILAGVDGLAVVQTPHATLIVSQNQDQLVKQAAAQLPKRSRRR